MLGRLNPSESNLAGALQGGGAHSGASASTGGGRGRSIYPGSACPPDRSLRDSAMEPLPPSPCSLPRDALYEILLRLPAKDLCRLRAVCQAWRSLLSDPRFAAAHAVRHPGTLIVVGYEGLREGVICDIMDLSGRVVLRVPAQEGLGRVMSIQLDLICTEKRMRQGYKLLNPVTRAVCALPEGFAKEHAQKRGIFNHKAFLSFGKVPLTGECKVLRILDNLSDIRPKQLCEISTLGAKDSQWRKKMSPKDIVYLGVCKSVVMDEVVYFLSYLPDCIASFDLHTEIWSEALQGPASSLVDGDSTLKCNWTDFSLATLNGCLVVVHHSEASIDLWFLVDMEKGLWVKQHSMPPIPISYRAVISPLFVLDDGRIVLMEMQGEGFIRTYNPRSNTLADIAVVGSCVAVGLYTGSLLSPSCSAN